MLGFMMQISPMILLVRVGVLHFGTDSSVVEFLVVVSSSVKQEFEAVDQFLCSAAAFLIFTELVFQYNLYSKYKTRALLPDFS